MIITHLQELLNTLTEQERAEFRMFLHSPYFNRGKEAAEIIRLAEQLLAEGGTLLLDRALGNTSQTSGLLDLLRRFLVEQFTNRKKDDPAFLLDLAHTYFQRGLFKRFKSLMQKIETRLEELPYKDAGYFWLRFQKDQQWFEYQNLHNLKRDDVNLGNTLESIFLFYESHRLRLLGLALLQNVVTSAVDIPLRDWTLRELPLPAELTEQYPILNLLQRNFQNLSEKTFGEAEIWSFQEVLTRHSAHIPEEFRKEFATNLRNFCTLRIYYGKDVDKSIGILYELIQEHYQAGMLHYDGKIAPHTLLNVAIMALRQEDPAWLQQVLEDNRGKIVSDNDGNDYYRLLWALLYKYQKNWESALQHLPDTPFRELDYWLTHSRLELVLLYETRSPLLLYRMDAFKVQLTRYSAKHLTPIRRKPQSLFLNLLYQLVHTQKGQNKRIQKIENRILSKDFVPEKRWFLEKLAELKS